MKSSSLTTFLQIGFVALLLISIPATITLTSKPQDNRSNALVLPGNTPTPTNDPTAPTATPTPLPTSVQATPTLTVTPTPPPTSLYLELNLEGFNGTQTPLRTTEPITVQLKETTTGKITSIKNATLVYSPNVRHFVTTIGFDSTFIDGTYIILVDPASYLTKNIGTYPLKANQQNELTYETLRSKLLYGCDPNNDNRVDAVDMQAMIDTLQGGVKNTLLDMTFDNKIDIFDHNVCLRNLDLEAIGDTFTTAFVYTLPVPTATPTILPTPTAAGPTPTP